MKKIIIVLLVLVAIGFLIPQRFSMPVEGATNKDYHPQSFWYYPWGNSGTHKGVDIFASKGTNLNSPVPGWVLYTGNIEVGGNVVLVIGPKWRIHYFAHLDEITTSFGWIKRSNKIGTIGDSGNAKGKPPHVHYAIITLFPYPWRVDSKPQGWKKMFYLDPTTYLAQVHP